MTTRFYIDGLNLYYRALKGTFDEWLDLEAFAQRLTPHDQIDAVIDGTSATICTHRHPRSHAVTGSLRPIMSAFLPDWASSRERYPVRSVDARATDGSIVRCSQGTPEWIGPRLAHFGNDASAARRSLRRLWRRVS